MSDVKPAELRIEKPQHDANGLPVLVVSGDLDISTAQALENAIAASGGDAAGGIVLNLAALRFMDSAGIAVLLRAVPAVGEVRVREPSKAVLRVLELSGLEGVLVIER